MTLLIITYHLISCEKDFKNFCVFRLFVRITYILANFNISAMFSRKPLMRVKSSIAVLLSVKSHCGFFTNISSQWKSSYVQNLLMILIVCDLHYVVFSYLI